MLVFSGVTYPLTVDLLEFTTLNLSFDPPHRVPSVHCGHDGHFDGVESVIICDVDEVSKGVRKF